MKAMDVCRFAEISYRQLDYWTRKGYISTFDDATPGSGVDREYSRTQANKARLMLCLISVGFEVQLAEKVASFAILGEYKIFIGHGVTLTIENHEHKERR